MKKIEPDQPKLINELKLDLACGQNRTEGYFGIDIIPGDKVDAVVDLEEFPWPIESESAEDIVCNHYIEHNDYTLFLQHFLILLAMGILQGLPQHQLFPPRLHQSRNNLLFYSGRKPNLA